MDTNNSNVSTEAIEQAINHIRDEFMKKLKDDIQQIVDEYTTMIKNGTLSSATIDETISGVQRKITELQDNFETIATEITKNMTQSVEAITANRSNIENELGHM